MNDTEKVQTSEEYYVNEATLDLLQRRLGSEVKRDFFLWMGLPAGGAGIAAILYALFVWMPGTLDKHVVKNPEIQRRLDHAAQRFFGGAKGLEFVQHHVEAYVTEYLGDPETGKKVVVDQVNQSSTAYLKAEPGQQLLRSLIEQSTVETVRTAVGTYFGSENGRTIVQGEVARSTPLYFQDVGGREQVSSAVKAEMKSDEIRQLIRQSIEHGIGNLRASIEQRKADAVAEVERGPSLEGIAKGSLHDLDRFLQERGRALQRSQTPVALTFAVRPHPYYVEDAIRQYVERLKEFFGQQFKYCLVASEQGNLLAFATVAEFTSVWNSNEQRPRLMTILHSGGAGFTEVKAKADLATMLGQVPAIPYQWTIFKTLTADIWPPRGNDRELPVIDARGALLGVTSRARLIDALVERL